MTKPKPKKVEPAPEPKKPVAKKPAPKKVEPAPEPKKLVAKKPAPTPDPEPKKPVAKKPAPTPDTEPEVQTQVTVEFKPDTAGYAPEAARAHMLDDWMNLNKQIHILSEKELVALIEHERRTRLRPNVILRLHGRMNKLRAQRERAEFMRPAK